MARSRTATILSGSLAATATSCLLACGYPVPTGLIPEGGKAVLAIPVTTFQAEIDHLLAQVDLPAFANVGLPGERMALLRDRPPPPSTAEADIADLRRAAEGNPTGATGHGIEEYISCRAEIERFVRKQAFWREHGRSVPACMTPNGLPEWMRGDFRDAGFDPERPIPPVPPSRTSPESVPEEFRLYLQGAIHYHRQQYGHALEAWRTLLALPGDRRRNKSTWAAYMIGRTHLLLGRPGEAIPWLRRTRELATEGFLDSLGLEEASIGWEAHAELQQKRVSTALELYLAQYLCGDTGALASMAVSASRALSSTHEGLTALARNELPRRVITAFILSGMCLYPTYYAPEIDPHGGRSAPEEWVRALAAAGPPLVEEADRLAWTAYSAGDYDLAGRWVGTAGPDNPMAEWIRAKLALRNGDIESAARHLAVVTNSLEPREGFEDTEGIVWAHVSWGRRGSYDLPTEPIEDRARGELGLVRLSQEDFTGSLHTFLMGLYLEDAAYVAERILTPGELKAYVDANWTEGRPGRGEFIRNLLACRLTRMDRWDEARPYFNEQGRALLDRYVEAIRGGRDTTRTDPQRALSFWTAATLARGENAWILQADTEPRWYSSARPVSQVEPPLPRVPVDEEDPLPVQRSEQEREERHLPSLHKEHFHRYVAVRHAWSAIDLMPDNHDLTARMLLTAGNWIRHQDPEEADPLYHALVLRCGVTEAGRAADRLHWFPKIEVHETALLADLQDFARDR